LKKDIYELEEAVLQYNLERYMYVNPFIAWVYLILGIFLCFVSFIWYLHML